jgi:hypothetical protein
MKKFIKAVIIGYVTLWLYDEGKEWWNNRNKPTNLNPVPGKYTDTIDY